MPARRPQELTELKPARVAIVKPSALGDVTNAFATLGALRRHWPEAEFTWVINAGLRGLVEGHPWIDRVIPYDRGKGIGARSIAALVRLLGRLGRERFDVAIDLQGLLRSGLMTAATRAPVRVGLADAREGATRFYTHRVIPPGSIDVAHAVDRLLAVAEAFGASVRDPSFAIAISEGDRRWARGVLSELPRPILAVNLGARWETKRWPPAHFAAVARRAVASHGAGLVAVGAPEDRLAVAEFCRLVAPIPVRDLSGGTTLPQLGAIAEHVDVVLSNDTGPLHLAAAAGARVVGVYTCTSPALNGPYGRHALTAETNVWCKASYRVRCERLECMIELDPARVWPLVERQLDAARQQRAEESAA